MKEKFDVVVVGAGPVGLLAAIELKTYGLDVLVLERLASPSMTIKALGVGPLGGEALQRRGMAAALDAEEERRFAAMERNGGGMRARSSKFAGHFGFLFIRREVLSEPDRRMRLVNQQDLEAILAERARTLGIALCRGWEVTGFAERDHGIDVLCASPDGARTICGAYLVGCDGGRSTIRKMAGFAFPGTEPTMTMYNAVVELDRPELLAPPGWQRTLIGVFSYGGLFPGRLAMLDFDGPPKNREAPVTREEVEAALRRISGKDVRVTGIDVANRWTDNTRLVDTYRQGRVLLAGDSAHVHSPFGGQGLSLGLADAANLGWKLAAVVRGEMPETLLDSYTAERRPVAEEVLANTLAQVAIMRPDPQSGAMRDILARLLDDEDGAARFFGEIMSGRSVRYDLGSTHDLVGRLLGERLVGETTLYDAMQDGKGVLLDATPGGEATRLVAATTTRVRCIAIDGGPSLLIRPDACVAWSGEDVEGLEDAVRRWFVPGAAGPSLRIARLANAGATH